MSSMALNLIVIILFVALPVAFIVVASKTGARKIKKAFVVAAAEDNLKIDETEVLFEKLIMGIDFLNKKFVFGEYSTTDKIEVKSYDFKDFRKVEVVCENDNVKGYYPSEIYFAFTKCSGEKDVLRVFNADIDGPTNATSTLQIANRWGGKLTELLG